MKFNNPNKRLVFPKGCELNFQIALWSLFQKSICQKASSKKVWVLEFNTQKISTGLCFMENSHQILLHATSTKFMRIYWMEKNYSAWLVSIGNKV